jgi:hypothetical protein
MFFLEIVEQSSKEISRKKEKLIRKNTNYVLIMKQNVHVYDCNESLSTKKLYPYYAVLKF